MEKQKLSYAEKVAKHQEGGDIRRINSFYKHLVNSYKDDIELTEREIKKLEEKIIEIKESKVEFLFNIDFDKIQDVDSRVEYAKDFGQRLVNFDVDKIKPLEEELNANKERIKILKDTLKYIENTEPSK